MTVIVESKKMKVTLAMRMFAEQQAQKISKFGKDVSVVRIYIENISKKKMDKNSNLVIYKVSLPGKDIIVKKQASDMYAAIAAATEGACRKLRKSVEKKKTLRRGYRVSS